MRKFLPIIIVLFFSLTIALAQKSGPLVKQQTNIAFAKNSNENALYADGDFFISNVYPNPADAFVQIDYTIPNDGTKVKIEFRNILGSVVSEYILTSETKRIKIGTADMAPGIYFHTLYLDSRDVVTKKLVIKR